MLCRALVWNFALAPVRSFASVSWARVGRSGTPRPGAPVGDAPAIPGREPGPRRAPRRGRRPGCEDITRPARSSLNPRASTSSRRARGLSDDLADPAGASRCGAGIGTGPATAPNRLRSSLGLGRAPRRRGPVGIAAALRDAPRAGSWPRCRRPRYARADGRAPVGRWYAPRPGCRCAHSPSASRQILRQGVPCPVSSPSWTTSPHSPS